MKSFNQILFFIVFQISSHFISTSNAQSSAECSALADIYTYTNGASWYTIWPSQPGTSSCPTVCSYYEVLCSGGHVTQLNLVGNNLVGTIPSSIVNLTFLQYLALDSNSLTGSIPSNIGSFSSLLELSLSSNSLSGSMPSSIGNLLSLTQLYLYNNQLSGSIPSTIGNLVNLKNLILMNNLLSGQFPTTLNNTQTTITNGNCAIATGNSGLCHIAGQTYPPNCTSDLSALPLCPATTRTSTTTISTVQPTTTTTSTTTTTTTSITTTTTSTSTSSTTNTMTSTSPASTASATTATFTSTAVTAIAPASVPSSGSLLPSTPGQATPLTTIIILVVVFISVIVAAIGIWWWLRRSALQWESVKSRELSQARPLDSLTLDTQSQQSDIMKTMMETVIKQGAWFALPGHLLLEMGGDVRIIGDIAQGGGGAVKLAEMLRPRISSKEKIVVLKLFNANEDSNTAKAIWQQEISIMWSFKDHDNIAKLVGYIEDPLGIIMHNYAASLQALILREVAFDMPLPITPDEAMGIAIGIANGMEALHEASVLHLDLKPANVLIDLSSNGTYIPAITDFGISQIIGSDVISGRLKSEARGFSVRYASPEAIWLFREAEVAFSHIATKEDATMDCYSFAIILYELLELKLAWDGLAAEDVCRRVVNCERPIISHHVKDSKKESVGIMMSIMKKAWSQNAFDRPSFEQMKGMLMNGS